MSFVEDFKKLLRENRRTDSGEQVAAEASEVNLDANEVEACVRRTCN